MKVNKLRMRMKANLLRNQEPEFWFFSDATVGQDVGGVFEIQDGGAGHESCYAWGKLLKSEPEW